MKARIRGTNIELDVQPCYDETGYFSGFKDGYEYYRAADLVFPDTPDWDTTDWVAFRREAAKDILCAMLEARKPVTFQPVLIGDALRYTNALIEQLKEEKK